MIFGSLYAISWGRDQSMTPPPTDPPPPTTTPTPTPASTLTTQPPPTPTSTTRPPLALTIALDTLRHLGMNLYSSLPPVLSELVANAYDARARRVDVTIDGGTVTLRDDGVGMTREELQTKYLVVGRDRRVADPAPDPAADPFAAWPRREKPMGRKGIGKLAMFSIANVVEILSARDGICIGMRMEREGIEDASRANRPYNPIEFTPEQPIASGTKIVLKDLRRTRAISPDAVKKAIARRFSVVGTQADGVPDDSDFSVYVNDSKVTAEHWDIFRSLQGLWCVGAAARTRYATRCTADCTIFDLPDQVTLDGTTVTVTGWLGTVYRPEQLKSGSGETEINDNRIVIDARGKVAIANFLHQFGESGVYASYLAGYIRADFLDDTDDIATSDRERMREDDPRVQALKTYVKALLKTIQSEWASMRRNKALAQNQDTAFGPVVAEWIAGLTPDEQQDAKDLLGRLSTARFAVDEDQAQVLRYGILAFERFRVRKSLYLLRNVSADDFAAIASMFALESDLENALYADIANQRLAVVRKLQGLVDINVKERVIQQHIFDHLWLLEPSWTIQDQLGARLEESVRTEFAAAAISAEEAAGRLDIRYRRSGGIHIIVELKRPSVRTTVYELLGQTQRYKGALAACLRQIENDTTPNIQCVCLVGQRPTIGPDEEKVLAAAGTKILTYDEVINSSGLRFQDYLNAHAQFGRIQSILTKLDAIGAGPTTATVPAAT